MEVPLQVADMLPPPTAATIVAGLGLVQDVMTKASVSAEAIVFAKKFNVDFMVEVCGVQPNIRPKARK